tara:strand:- start:2147 stop:3049 length:903 start_codon:yes stop_codon:yes gene_type:complete
MNSSNKDFSQFQKKFTERINLQLKSIFTKKERNNGIIQPMEYSSVSGSKFIRSLLVYSTGDAFNVNPELLDKPALAIELIHTYSLIHDDLPCMDDDDIRRGKPSCHIKFGESSAVLAGDALQSIAFEILSDKENIDLPDKIQLSWINYLAKSIGYKGIAEGQFLDLSINNKIIDIKQLDEIYSLKTSSLIKPCLIMPAMIANQADSILIQKLEVLGNLLGISFQIKDDLLGYTSSTEIIGKTKNKDELRNQPNYVNILGVEKTKQKLSKNKEQVESLLNEINLRNTMLYEISNYIFTRNH